MMSLTSILTLASSVTVAGVVMTVKLPELVETIRDDGPTAFMPGDRKAALRFDEVAAGLQSDGRATSLQPLPAASPRPTASYGMHRWRQIMEIGRSSPDRPQATRSRRTAGRPSTTPARVASRSASHDRHKSVFERSRFGRRLELRRRLDQNGKTYRPIQLPNRHYSLNAVGNRSIFERSRSFRENGSRYPLYIKGRTVRSRGRR